MKFLAFIQTFLLCLVLMLCYGILDSKECHAGVPVNLVHISTASALLTGRTCNLVRLKIDAAGGGDSFSILNCTTWTAGAPHAEVNLGVPMLSINVQGVGVYYSCRFLDQDFGTPQPYVEFDCHGDFFPSEMFTTGFDK